MKAIICSGHVLGVYRYRYTDYILYVYIYEEKSHEKWLMALLCGGAAPGLNLNRVQSRRERIDK